MPSRSAALKMFSPGRISTSRSSIRKVLAAAPAFFCSFGLVILSTLGLRRHEPLPLVGRGRGGVFGCYATSVVHCRQNGFANTLRRLQHIGIPEAQDAIALRLQP